LIRATGEEKTALEPGKGGGVAFVGDDRPVWDSPHGKCVEAWSNCTLSGVSQGARVVDGGGAGLVREDAGVRGRA
jgi:hypothetical protein